MRRVIVHIDRLVLRGVSATDRTAVAESLTRELTIQLARPGVAGRLSSQPDTARLEAGRIRAGAATPVALGRSVGRAITQKVTA
jgi:hypothetical protein